MILIAAGQEDVTTYFQFVDPATGGPLTGATITDIDLAYIRDRTLAVKNDATALALPNASHADNQVIQASVAFAPGLYRIDWPDEAFAAGVEKVTLYVRDGSGADAFVVDPVEVVLEARIGTPVALDGGLATVFGVLTKLADDADGASFDAETDSQRAIKASIVAGFPTHSPATAGNITTGTNTAGSFVSTALNDGVYWQVAAAAAVGGFGLNMDLTFALGTELKAATITVNAKESLGGVVLVWAWNYTTLTWDQIADTITGITGSSDKWYTYILLHTHQQASDGEIQIRFTSTDTAVNKYLYLDQVVVDAVAISAVTPAEIGQAVMETDLDLIRHEGAEYLAGHLIKRVLALGTAIVTEGSTTSFTLSAGIAVADAYNDMLLEIRDVSSGTRDIEIRRIVSWTAGRVVTVDRAYSFLPTVGDEAHVHNKYAGTNVKAMATDVVSDAAVSAAAVTKIQAGLAVPGDAMTLETATKQEIAANNYGRDIWYVSATGAGGNDGLSWTTAKANPKTVIEAAAAGDLVIIGPGDFDIGVNVIAAPAGIGVRGAGMSATVIQSQAARDVDGTIFLPGDNCRLEDFTVEGTLADGTYQVPIGCQQDMGEAAFTGLWMERIEMIAETDGFLVVTNDPIDGVGIDCRFISKFDGINCSGIAGLGNYLFIRPRIFVTGPNLTGSSTARGIISYGGKIVVVDPQIEVKDMTVNTYGIQTANAAGRISVIGGSVLTSSANGTVLDLVHVAGVLSITGLTYDLAKISGTIIDLDQRAVDEVLDTAIPGAPTADSIYERVKAVDDKLPTSDYIKGTADADGGMDNADKADVKAEDQSAMTDQGYTTTRAPKLDALDAAVSTRSSHTAAQAGTDAAAKVLETPANLLATDGDGKVTAENMRGTDGASTVDPDNAGIADNGAAIAALNNLSQAEAQVAAAAALTAYDPPTNAEMVARTKLEADYANASDQTAIKAKTDGLNFTGDDVKATLDGEKVVVETNEDKIGYKLASDGLDSVAITEPSGVAANFREMVVQLWRRFFGKTTLTKTATGAGTLKTLKEDGSTTATTQAVTDDGATETQGEAS